MTRELEVAIDGLAVFARHGALPEEQAIGQRFYLDVRYRPLSDAACDSDALPDAVDYGAVALRALELASGGPYALIERLGEVVAGTLLHEFPLAEVTVRVRKPSAPVPAVLDGVAVTVTRRRPVERALVGAGGNLGDVRATLRAALQALGAMPGVEIVRASSLYRTAPVGGPAGQPEYLNAAVALDTSLPPHALLARLQELEQAAGREREIRFGPRTLDLDVLLYGRRTIDDPQLLVPHPRLLERRFALEPLLEVEPGARLPDGSSIADVLRELPPQGVERLEEPVFGTI